MQKKQNKERIYQYGYTGKRDGTSYSEDLLSIHISNDYKLHNYVQRNKKVLLSLPKEQLISVLKKNVGNKNDNHKIKNEYVRSSYLKNYIRNC